MIPRYLRMASYVTLLLAPSLTSAQNVLVNGDFESNPPNKLGNNVNYSIAPWVLGIGQQSNVVKVNGTAFYGSQGPAFDATSKGTNQVRHYLDIARGANSIYQSFTPKCSGQINFGGWFSTRDNTAGQAKISLRKGVGIGGELVQSNPISLPGGLSQTDAWKKSAFVATISANTTYSFVVDMTDYVNFDEAYANYVDDCTPPPVASNPCCPPWNADVMLSQLRLAQPGGLTGPTSYAFANTAPFKMQIQAYLDYLHAMNPSIRNFTLSWTITDNGPSGPGTSPSATGSLIGKAEATEWSCLSCPGSKSGVGGGGNLTSGNGTNVFGPATIYALKPNRWYRITTVALLNNGIAFWPDSCSRTAIEVTVYARATTTGAQPSPNQLAVEVRQPGSGQSRVVMMPLMRPGDAPLQD